MARLILSAALLAAFFFSSDRALADTDAEARMLYQAGVAAYDAGRYEEAYERFKRAYELSDREALLYNIGSAAERARMDEEALDAYERFLEAEPDSRLRVRIEAVIERLRRGLAEAAVASTSESRSQGSSQSEAAPLDEAAPILTEASLSREEDAPNTKRGPWPYITIGAGGAVLITGAITLGMGLSDRTTVERPAEGARDWQRDAERSYERGPRLLTTGIIALPIGAALTAAGVVMAIKRGKDTDDDPEAASVELSFGGTSLSLHGRF